MSYLHPKINNRFFYFLVGSAGVVSVIIMIVMAVTKYYPKIFYGTDRAEAEWITGTKPETEAEKMFRNGEIYFLETYRYITHQKKPENYWIIPGRGKIPSDVLNKYPHKKLTSTCTWGMSDKDEQLQRKAISFSEKFNLKMYSLIKNNF